MALLHHTAPVSFVNPEDMEFAGSGKQKYMLVYQGQIAHVFRVRTVSLRADRRMACHVFTGDYREAFLLARARLDKGHSVKTAHCEARGDIADVDWLDGPGRIAGRERGVVSSPYLRPKKATGGFVMVAKKPKLNRQLPPGRQPSNMAGSPPVGRANISHAAYLKTPQWRAKRKSALAIADYRCRVCNAANVTLDVHHRTYERLGNESVTDLIVLCRECHDVFHKSGRLATK